MTLNDTLVHGKTVYRIRWRSEAPSEPSATAADADRRGDAVTHLTGLRLAGVRLLGPAASPTAYEVDPAWAHWWGSSASRSREPRYRLTPDQVAVFTWPFPIPGTPSPVAAIIPEFWANEVWMRGSLAAMAARVASGRMGLRLEAARYRNHERAHRDELWAGMRAHHKLGGSHLIDLMLAPSLVRPMTDYYTAWQHAEAVKRAIRMRVHLLEQFTEQVLRPLARRNNLSDDLRLVAHDVRTEADVDAAFGAFAAGEIDLPRFRRQLTGPGDGSGSRS